MCRGRRGGKKRGEEEIACKSARPAAEQQLFRRGGEIPTTSLCRLRREERKGGRKEENLPDGL